MITTNISEQVSFTEFTNNLKQSLQNVFSDPENKEHFTHKRGFPAKALRDIMANNPLSVAIPKQYGGRGNNVKEALGLLNAASFESLPLSLTFGINIALFLEPVIKYGQESIKKNLLNRFLNEQNMGGLMITEPKFGSDALSMQTSNVKNGSKYHIKGTKHWQGLTGLADYWLITSRNLNEQNKLQRDIDFFVCDTQQVEQRIHVEEYYNNMGLYPIPYGKNIIDIKVDEQFKLKPETTGLKLMIDLLHRSRYHFPGMGMGFLRRILDEAIKHCSTRIVNAKPLIELDQVKHQISKIQSAYTVCSAMCSRSAAVSGIENDLTSSAIEANTMKAFVTDLMQESAQTFTQLSGGNGYKAESLGTKAIVDSRPFQIFEGANDMLYTQIAEIAIKEMARKKITKFFDYIKNSELTKNVADHFKSILDFSIGIKLPQRKVVDLGKIISRTVSADLVIKLGIKGFRPDLIHNSLETLKHDVSMLVNSYRFKNQVAPIEEYKDSGNWLDFV